MTVLNGDILRVTAKLGLSGQECQNVYHVRADVLAPETDEEVVTSLATWLDNAYGEIITGLTTGCEFNTIEVFNVTQDRPMNEVGWPTRVAGTNGGDTLPNQVSALVRFPTDSPGSQGRKFISGFGEGVNLNFGELDSLTIADLVLFAAELLAGAEIAATPVLFPGNWNETLSRFAPWLSAIVNDYFATQRRRRVGVGV